MNTEEMYSAINKGVPNQIRLELPVSDLLEYCSSDRSNFLTSIYNIRNKYENAITSISGYNKSNHEFFDNLRLITNYKTSDTQIYVSPIIFLKHLKEILGVTTEDLDLNNDDFTNELRTRFNILY